MIEKRLGITVIGGGAAGLAAAIAAKESGVDSILILERNANLGGILPQCVHTGFGLHYFRENLTGPEYIDRFIKKVQDLQIAYKLQTMVLDVTPQKEVIAINQYDGLLKLKADAIILAMGCRERSRGALCIPGTRPAGIFTAGTAQRLMDIEGYIPGKKVLILGSGDVGLIMARRFAMEGIEVKGVVEIMPYAGGLNRNIQCLRDFGIPLYLRHAVTFIHGTNRVEGVTISKLDKNGQPIENEAKTIECDTLIISAGLIPENELSKKAGIRLDPKTVTQDSEEAGRNAAKKIFGKLPQLKKRIRLKAMENIRYVVPQVISGQKPLTLYARVKKPAFDKKIKIGRKIELFKRVVKPPELVTINLTAARLRRMEKKKEIPVTMSI